MNAVKRTINCNMKRLPQTTYAAPASINYRYIAQKI